MTRSPPAGIAALLRDALRRLRQPLVRRRNIAPAEALWSAAALCAFAASVVADPGWGGLLGGALALAMTAIAAIDARRFLIPDPLVLAALVLGLVHAALAGTDGALAAMAAAGLRAGVLALLFLGFRIAYRRIRGREGLGLGDVKLAAVAGAWLGWALAGLAVDIAALSALGAVLIGALRGRRIAATTRIPFGLFFAPAIWLAWLFEAVSLRL
jgi:leader peptidase (prepilin peptidase)/N-methyltransferase